MSRQLQSYVSLTKSRVFPVIIYSLNMVLALIASSKLNGNDVFTFGRNLAHSLLTIVPIVLSVYIYNDLTDIEIDILNNLDRPLATGEVSKKEARTFVIILGIVGLATSLTINLRVFLLTLTYFVLAVSYSFPPIRLKSKFLINKITVAVGIAISYLIGGAVAGSIPVPVFLIATYGFVSGLSVSIVIDFRDMGGDKKYEVKTLSLTWDPKIIVRFAIALIGMIGIAIVIGFYQIGSHIAFLILASCGFAAWIYVLYPLFQHWSDPSYVENTVQKKISVIGFFIQTLLVLGVFL